MRKHPLIALIAFTTLGASVIAGASTGSFNSILTSTKGSVRTSDRVAKAANPTYSPTPVVVGGRNMLAVHDPWRPNRVGLSSFTGLPLRPAVHRHRTRHVVVVTSVAPAAPAPKAAPVTATTSPPAAPAEPAGGVWYELRMCESGDNYATDTGNGYYGAYQFALSTWYGLGFSGLPSDASPAVQDEAARELQARSGWGQWPVCAARLGLY